MYICEIVPSHPNDFSYGVKRTKAISAEILTYVTGSPCMYKYKCFQTKKEMSFFFCQQISAMGIMKNTLLRVYSGRNCCPYKYSEHKHNIPYVAKPPYVFMFSDDDEDPYSLRG